MERRVTEQNQEGLNRLPPQAVEVEQAALGAMMIGKRGTDRGVELLCTEDFYHGPHALIFTAAKALYEHQVSVDQLTLANELRKRGQLEEVGGVVYLATLSAQVATAANIDHHAQIVKGKAMGRHIIEVAAEMTSRAYEGREEPSELLDWAESAICSLAERGTVKEFRGLESIMHDTFSEIERVHNSHGSVTGLDTGYGELNDITSGFQPGDLIIMAARPSVGKTALSLCIARHAAVEHDVAVAVFSLEMSCSQVAQRLLCIESGVDLHKLRTGKLRDEDWKQLTRNVGRMAQAPVFVDDSPSLTVLELRAKARQLHRREDLGMIVVDYMQLMRGSGGRQNREQEVAEISRGLKGLARDLGVPVLAVSQLSRATEARVDRRPQLSDLRESGSIEQDADLVMFIYRPGMYDIKTPKGEDLSYLAEVIVAKQRNGPTGNVRLMWQAKSARFENLAEEYRIQHEGQQRDRWDLDLDLDL